MNNGNYSLEKLPNIGKILASRLREAGIDTQEKLFSTGSCEAWKKLRDCGQDACLDTLYALDGAILGIRWHSLPPGRKAELTLFFRNETSRSI